MPLVIHPRLRKGLAVLATTAAGVLGPAAVASAACPTQPTTPAFSQFGDQSQYFAAPGGTFEGGSSSWNVYGDGSGVTAGNEPFHVNSSADTRSLSVGGGATAYSPSFCIDATMLYFRFFSKQSGSAKPLSVSLVLSNGTDWEGSTIDPVATLPGSTSWSPSGQLALASLLNIPVGGSVQAKLKFQLPESSGSWSIDDVMVDPYRIG